MLPTELRTGQFPMPTCQYTIHAGTPDGPPIRYAIVGQSVFHKWTCDDCECTHCVDQRTRVPLTALSKNLFKMRVFNCFAGVEGGGNGERWPVIDEDG
jgi:hypothetical protein